jgi:hypothetical protein
MAARNWMRLDISGFVVRFAEDLFYLTLVALRHRRSFWSFAREPFLGRFVLR